MASFEIAGIVHFFVSKIFTQLNTLLQFKFFLYSFSELTKSIIYIVIFLDGVFDIQQLVLPSRK